MEKLFSNISTTLRPSQPKDKDVENLDIVLVLFGVLILAFLVFCCYHYRLFQRFLNWISNCREKRLGLREPLLGGFFFTRERRDVLIKRCDQSSTSRIEGSIIASLKRNSSIHIVEGAWDRIRDDGQNPVIVFCVISSRIGTDIENAMRGVHGNSPVLLVLLHCVLSSSLRGDLSDDEELLDDTLKYRMRGIAHFAFSDREGLYIHHQNTVGFEKLNSLVSWLTAE